MSNLREKAIEIAKQTSSESAFMVGYDRACVEYEAKLISIKTEIENTIEYLRDFQNENKKSKSKDKVIVYETCLSHFEEVLSSF